MKPEKDATFVFGSNDVSFAMPINEKYIQALMPEGYFHIYSRTNNQDLLFKSEDNRKYFLRKYALYLSAYVKTFAYCLMDNHFHLLIQVRREEEILKAIRETPKEKRLKIHEEVLQQPVDEVDFPAIIHKQFYRWFTSYSMAFNRAQNRKGNLFNRPFKRLAVNGDDHFLQLVYYIHANPSLHKVYDDFTEYQWSSYQSLLSNKPTLLERNAVIDWFGNKTAFIKFHQIQHNVVDFNHLLMEDEI